MTRCRDNWAASTCRNGLNVRVSTNIWRNLVVETQFATELTLSGLRRLCSVPTDAALVPWGSQELNYSLHVGMYSFSSGLERLSKLAIACNVYAETGSFPKLKKYSHRIGDLLDAVEGLTPSGIGISKYDENGYLIRPVNHLDPDLTQMVQRFANGAGRYEHLDSLSDVRAEVNTYKDWSELAARASVSREVNRLISLKEAMAHALESELLEAGLEATADSVIEDLSVPTYEPSVGVVLALFEQVRWVSSILDVATYYTKEEIPILGEVISPTFIHTSENFFNFSIARISDDYVVGEELEEVYERIHEREAEIEDEN